MKTLATHLKTWKLDKFSPFIRGNTPAVLKDFQSSLGNISNGFFKLKKCLLIFMKIGASRIQLLLST